MKLHDIAVSPWAITPAMFAEVQGIYARHLRGNKIDLKGLEANLGRPLQGPTKGYDVVDGVAIVPVDGVLAKRMNLMTEISGGTSMQILADDIREAIDDFMVSAIVLNIDSPGGTVDGTQELANIIFNARGGKPIIALADGCMCSAAYWIGSAADEVYITSDTTNVGSIGVVATHTDVSGMEEQEGVRTTEITAGKYKRIASQYEPLTTEGRQSIQEAVDYTYSVFVNDVARNRGVSTEQVLKDMADGRVFIGRQSVDAGLVDGVSTLSELIGRLSNDDFSDSSSRASGTGVSLKTTVKPNHAKSDGVSQTATHEEITMDVAKLKAEFPAIAEALIAEGKIAGATAECERIQSVEAQALPGHEALIATLKFDGKTSGAEAAMQVLHAEKAKKGKHLANLENDASNASVTHAAAPLPGDEDEPDEDDMPEGKKAKAGQNPHVLAQKATEYQREQTAKGNKVSTAEAVAYVSAQK